MIAGIIVTVLLFYILGIEGAGLAWLAVAKAQAAGRPELQKFKSIRKK